MFRITSMKKHYCVAIFILLCFQFSFSQDKIECDRPDQTETPAIVPAGHFQMESGFYYEHESKDEQRITYPASLLKYGIADVAEIRVEIENSSSILHESSEVNRVHGISPLALGMKLKICEEKKTIPKISVIVMTSIPILASKKLKENFPTSEIRFTFQHTLSKRFSFSYNLGGLWDGTQQKIFGLYTITSGYTITENLGCYIEVYGFVAKEQDHRFDGGFTFTPQKNVMLDISAGISIDKKLPSWFGGLGVSFLLPN